MGTRSRATTRRQFLSATAAIPVVAGVSLRASAEPGAGVRGPELLIRKTVGPVAVSSGNGKQALQIAVEQMTAGKSPVDSAVAGVNVVEADPEDMSVGYGGLPNADGVVELDSCVMDGPTHLAGAVGALRNIMHPSRVALVVMRRTDHVLLVGEGALRFAKQHGFKEQNLLTDRARERWLAWKEAHHDDYIPPGGNSLDPGDANQPRRREEREWGTIHLSALNAAGDLGACTTTSGLSWKIPGRVGDSPLIGCGLYTDNDVGSAGSTGRGEAAILSNGAHLTVEAMRRGLHPKDACLETIKRVAHYTRIPRLLNNRGEPAFGLNFYAVNKKGEFGAASMRPSRFRVCDSEGERRVDTAYLYGR